MGMDSPAMQAKAFQYSEKGHGDALRDGPVTFVIAGRPLRIAGTVAPATEATVVCLPLTHG